VGVFQELAEVLTRFKAGLYEIAAHDMRFCHSFLILLEPLEQEVAVSAEAVRP
jgi:hypothetical protein